MKAKHEWGEISCARCGVRRVLATGERHAWLFYGAGWCYLGRKEPECPPLNPAPGPQSDFMNAPAPAPIYPGRGF